MREIKFRAWNGERMLNRTLFDRNWYTHDDKCVMAAMPRDANTLKVMQYTGLKDKNGVEIYEGDVVKSLGDQDYTFGTRLVLFVRGSFTVEGYVLIGGLVEVIGNIYENPELLK